MIKRIPQKLINVPVAAKPKLESLPGFMAELQAVEHQLGDRGRALVRYSGTQMICRVMVEADSDDMVSSAAARLTEAISSAIGCK